MTNKAVDMLVETTSPDALDRTVNQFGAAVCGGGMPEGYTKIDGCFVVRCFTNADFIKFVIENQGYGKVKRVYDGLYNEASFEGVDNE